MSRIVFLALAIGVVAANAEFPRSLADIFTGSRNKPVITGRAHQYDSIPYLEPNVTFIEQRLDNFNTQNNATFQQRYKFIDQYYKSGGPLYVILNPLGPLTPYDLSFTLMTQLASTEGALVFALENRYYGESIPTENLSVENLRYLTVEQVLADTANFVAHIKSTTPGAEKSPVIVSGIHYGGSLAVWFRQKYPHLTSGAWASSSPLLALQKHEQYKANAAATIRELAGEECFDTIHAGFQELEAVALGGHLDELSERLNVCKSHPLENHNDVATLFLIISEMFSSIATFNPANNPEATPGTGLATLVQNITDDYCLNVDYEEFIRLENDIELDSDLAVAGIRQLTYQMCTQLGWFSTSDSPDQPFGSFYPLSFFTEVCTRVFGEEVAGHAIAQYNQDRFNIEHGGLNPWISNAVFTHGENDPSRSIEVTRDLADSAVSFQIPNAGPGDDFYPIDDYSDDAVIEVQKNIIAAIRSWQKQ